MYRLPRNMERPLQRTAVPRGGPGRAILGEPAQIAGEGRNSTLGQGRPPAAGNGRAALLASCLALAAVPPATVRAQAATDMGSDDWPDLAELGRIEVVAVSRRPMPVGQSNTAVTVVTADDILRSSAKNIAECLRAVPGLDVAQIDANSWAISSRGFNSEYASKMLVMIDGRSVYSPLLSLTYWDTQNALLDDIAQIEVIRGPGD